LLDEKQVLELLDTVFKSNERNSELQHLKMTYFNIETKYQNLTKIKERIDKSVAFQINIRLLFLLGILIAQTLLFANWIWNTDFLGWDLVEPMTFLFSSIIFVGGLFIFVKLNRNSISGEKLVSTVEKRVRTKKYVKFNFNYLEYADLEVQKKYIKRLIDTYYCKH